MNIKCICPECGKEFYQYPSRVKQGITRCSNSCKGESMMGEKNRYYNPNGFINISGYRMISVRGKRHYEHVYIMEQHIGRELTKEEEVHHINGDKLDNRLENLQLITMLEHKEIHRNKVTGKFEPYVCSRFVEVG
jgi:hypothetical protein